MLYSYAALSHFSHIKNKFTPSAADTTNTQTLVAPSESAHPSIHSRAQIAGSQLGHYIHDMVLHYSMALINAERMSGIEANVYESYSGFSGKLVYFERFITGRRPFMDALQTASKRIKQTACNKTNTSITINPQKMWAIHTRFFAVMGCTARSVALAKPYYYGTISIDCREYEIHVIWYLLFQEPIFWQPLNWFQVQPIYSHNIRAQFITEIQVHILFVCVRCCKQPHSDCEKTMK